MNIVKCIGEWIGKIMWEFCQIQGHMNFSLLMLSWIVKIILDLLLLQSFKAILKTFQIILSIEDIFFKCHRFFWEKNKFNIGKQKPPCLPTEWHLFGLKCNSILQKSKQVVMWFCYGPWEYQTKSSLRKGHTSSERGGANGLWFLLLYLLILYLLCSYMRNCVTKQKNNLSQCIVKKNILFF